MSDQETTLPSSVHREPLDVRPAWVVIGLLAVGTLVTYFVAIGSEVVN